MKRYLVFPQDFDTRAYSLEDEKESWDEKPKQLHRENKKRLLISLEKEFGSIGFEGKIKNFKDMGVSPFSIVSFHNQFFAEIRRAFVVGSYYPALTGTCALGERMLNHMILTLRKDFKHTPEYKKIHRKESFDNCSKAISILSVWGVLSDDLIEKFNALQLIRNKSLHFNNETYVSVRDDSLEAIKIISEIISLRFGFFRKQHTWGIKGTKGAQFIKKEYENDPFIKNFYLPLCPLVGPNYAVKFIEHGTLFVDQATYPDDEITDDHFANLYNNRKPDDVVDSDFPLVDDVEPVGVLFSDGTYHLAEKMP